MPNFNMIMNNIFFILFIIPFCFGSGSYEFRNCSLLYNCGSLQGIGYPFWGGDRPEGCGRKDYNLLCVDGQYTILWIDHLTYRVLAIDPTIPKMTIARNDLWNDICPAYQDSFFKNSTWSKFNLNSARTVRNLNVFYGCTSEVIAKVQVQSNVTCSIEGKKTGVFFADEFISEVQGCKISLVVFVQFSAYNDLWDGKITLQEALNQGFDVEYNAALGACSSCVASGGKCGSNSRYEFVCSCQDQSYPMHCPKHGKNHVSKVMIVAGAMMAGLGVFFSLIVCSYYHKESKNDNDLEALIQEFGSLTPRRYSYSDIKKMTNCFKEKLGQGGYGEVYRGNLFDKGPVAVKILRTTKGNGKEFVNEVASISRTSHVNVVTLLGFCLDGCKRALIYEYMPNGSLDKYIHHESELHMGFERLHEIAVGIAQGLEYLHGGCNTRILHFDIKPHNILLDEEFCPKISDFGMAKLCARKESIVSMLGARGTIGYIAPEVFSRNFGGVSYKSDVYSYGMMILEMVGGRKNAADVQLSHSSEMYFPNWLYDHVLVNEDLKLQGHAMAKEENDIARKMILVGLWCIQTNPAHRPTMSKVIDMLKGSLMLLEVPPKPFLCSPSRSEAVSSETTVLIEKDSATYSSSPADSGTR